MLETKFDTTLRDSQGTTVAPVAPEQFDLNAYQEYEAELLENNREFVKAGEGLLVYRRVRADGVFYDKCRDYKESLALQLGALRMSMGYKADIANFLEPWYGIGYIASSFGGKYRWDEGQAPSVEQPFESVSQILQSDYVPVSATDTGKHTLEMIEYFMDKTKGKVPVSFSDIQSPMNMLSYLVPVTNLFYDIIDEPEKVEEAAGLLTDLLTDFLKEQRKLIGDALARPGHGFASSREFTGVGLSNDLSIMLQEDDYEDVFKSCDERLGDEFGGVVYHSCGVWEKKINMVKNYRNVFMADGAFTPETDPAPNRPEVFGDAFAGSGIILNARAVGSCETAMDAFSKLWRPGQKLICVTYCKTCEEQERLYKKLHEMERGIR